LNKKFIGLSRGIEHFVARVACHMLQIERTTIYTASTPLLERGFVPGADIEKCMIRTTHFAANGKANNNADTP